MRTIVATKRTGVTYVDDRVQFGPRQTLEAEIEAFSSDARGALGPTAVNDAKTILSTSFDTIGWRFNTIEGTVTPSPRAFLKLGYAFCMATPPDIKAGATMKVCHLQRLSSLAIRYSWAIVPLRPFSGAFARNTGGPDMDRNAIRHLSRPACADILAWRSALELAVGDQRRTVRAAWLALDSAPSQEQAARADVRIRVDSQENGGIGVYAPGLAWDNSRVHDTQFFISGNQKADRTEFPFISLTRKT